MKVRLWALGVFVFCWGILRGETPYVLLISLDGFRYDYVQKYQPPFLSQFVREQSCARAVGLQSVTPSKTFPNHWSIVTGLYAEHHELVNNEFYDPATQRTFSIRGPEVRDSRWYKGVPLWTALRNQNGIAASFFWPGSDVNDASKRPNYFKTYQHTTPHPERIDQIVTWLKMPEAERPHFLTLYFSDADDAGHVHGPDSAEVRDAVLRIDTSLRQLWTRLESLSQRVNVIIVSDHGMLSTENLQPIYLSDHIPSLPNVKYVGSGEFQFVYAPDADDQAKIMESLKNVPQVRAFRREDIPPDYHLAQTAMIGNILIETDPPYQMRLLRDSASVAANRGTHGYSPLRVPEMRGIFYARGPNIRGGNLPVFENVHVYPLIERILKLPPNPNIDGKAEVLMGVYSDE